MSTRREFLQLTAATGVVAATAARPSRAAPATPPRIKSAIRREETIFRLGGVGDGYQMTWADDDRQLVAVQDGAGWFEDPKGFYNSRLWAVSGGPQYAVFHDIPNYPELNYAASRQHFPPNYYSFGTLALDGYIYQFLSTLDQEKLRHWIGAKLIYSPDRGRTWHNQDGSTPVVWESVNEQSRERLAFFQEPQQAFSLLSFLQMGRNYESNRDGYVYVYSPNGNTDGSMNELVMARVLKTRILHRDAYEYFAGRHADGSARWTKSIDARAVVHTFPRGWINTVSTPEADLVVEAWVPSVTYNAPLGLYMMAACGTGCAADGSPFGKPSYLGFWTAPTPWGPWTQFHEETAWTPAGDLESRAFDLQIAPKWIAADGKSFWLVWADFKGHEQFGRAAQGLENESKQVLSDEARAKVIFNLHRQNMPRYAFNTQRVDLIVA